MILKKETVIDIAKCDLNDCFLFFKKITLTSPSLL